MRHILILWLMKGMSTHEAGEVIRGYSADMGLHYALYDSRQIEEMRESLANTSAKASKVYGDARIQHGRHAIVRRRLESLVVLFRRNKDYKTSDFIRDRLLKPLDLEGWNEITGTRE